MFGNFIFHCHISLFFPKRKRIYQNISILPNPIFAYLIFIWRSCVEAAIRVRYLSYIIQNGVECSGTRNLLLSVLAKSSLEGPTPVVIPNDSHMGLKIWTFAQKYNFTVVFPCPLAPFNKIAYTLAWFLAGTTIIQFSPVDNNCCFVVEDWWRFILSFFKATEGSGEDSDPPRFLWATRTFVNLFESSCECTYSTFPIMLQGESYLNLPNTKSYT